MTFFNLIVDMVPFGDQRVIKLSVDKTLFWLFTQTN